MEFGFANVVPKVPGDINSWAYYNAALSGFEVMGNRALGVRCYEAK